MAHPVYNSSNQPKIIDLLNANDKEEPVHISFEFFPPKNESQNEQLRGYIKTFARQRPVFVDFTWGAGGSTSDQTPAWCLYCMEVGLVANMHITCTNMPEGKVEEALAFAKAHGIRNIVALRGDPPAGQQQWKSVDGGFTCARDLVQHIRKTYGDYFCIAVAGYPEGHPTRIHSETGECPFDLMKEEISYLKSKVDAGADYIMTQLFYDTSHFYAFTERCRRAGVTCPILPGMLPFVSYGGLQRICQLCKTYVPPEVRARLEELKGDDAAVKKYGAELTATMCRQLMRSGCKHLHIYTLDLEENIMTILKQLNLYVA